MKYILKNKLCIILFLFMVIIFSISTNCFASTEDIVHFTNPFTSKDVTLKLPSGYGTDYKYYMIVVNESFYSPLTYNDYDDYGLFLSNSSIYKKNSIITTKNNGIHYEKRFSVLSGSKDVDFSDYSISDFSSYDDLVDTSLAHGTFVIANHIIYSDSTETELVFRPAPQGITQALVEQTTQLGMKPLEAIKVVVPVVIVTIVGLIAFWKAWQFLSKQLKKA